MTASSIPQLHEIPSGVIGLSLRLRPTRLLESPANVTPGMVAIWLYRRSRYKRPASPLKEPAAIIEIWL